MGRAPHPWAPQPLLVERPRSPWGMLPTAEAPRPHPSERHSCPKGRLFNREWGQIVWLRVCGESVGHQEGGGEFSTVSQIPKISKKTEAKASPQRNSEGVILGIKLIYFFDTQKLWDSIRHQDIFCSRNCFGLSHRRRLVSQDTCKVFCYVFSFMEIFWSG